MTDIPDMADRSSYHSSQHDSNGAADGTPADINQPDGNSDSEWEYEYSTTETEVSTVLLNFKPDDMPTKKPL